MRDGRRPYRVFQSGMEIGFFVVIACGAVVMMLPFLWMICTSFKDLGQAFTYPPRWIPSPPTLQNFKEVWRLMPFGRYLFNSTYIATTSTLAEMLTASLAAFAFARMRWRGRDVLFLLYLASLMVPGQVTLIPKFIMMRHAGLVDTYTGLILPGCFSAFGTFLLRQFFLTIPRELDEAAMIDGAGWLGIWGKIAIPLSKPALATLGLLSFMGSWNSFLWPLVMVARPEMRTLSLAIRGFSSEYGTYWTQMMAASTIALLPIIILYLTCQKYFVRGITTSGFGGR
ncbi:MAG: carbohydrate ABC transporter permease [Bacillota bacterium]